MENSRKIKDKLILLSNTGKLTMSDEMKILQHLVNKFNLISQAKYAKLNGITSAGAKKRLESGKEPCIFIGKSKYVVR
jgi:hypothetical protein